MPLMPYFSHRQQQIVGIGCLLYGIWLVWAIYADTSTRIESAPLIRPDPVDLPFYIEPPIDINTCSSDELQLLPDIGPTLAERIIAHRERYGPFTSLDALKQVKGIGSKTFQQLQYYLPVK